MPSLKRKRKSAAGIQQDRVAEAGLSVISELGIRSLTVATVARRLRMRPKRLASVYPNSRALLEMLLDYVETRLVEHVRAASVGVTDAIVRLERLTTVSLQAIHGDSRLLSVAMSIALSLGKRSRPQQQRVLSILTSYLKDVTEIVRDGQRLGRIRPDVDPGTVALMYLGLIQPAAILSHVSDGSFDLRNHVQRSFKLFREAIEA